MGWCWWDTFPTARSFAGIRDARKQIGTEARSMGYRKEDILDQWMAHGWHYLGNPYRKKYVVARAGKQVYVSRTLLIVWVCLLISGRDGRTCRDERSTHDLPHPFVLFYSSIPTRARTRPRTSAIHPSPVHALAPRPSSRPTSIQPTRPAPECPPSRH